MNKTVISFLIRLLVFAVSLPWRFVYLLYRRKYEIAPAFRFNGPRTLIYGEGSVHLGPGSYIGHDSSLQATPGQKIIIGAHCSISHFFSIYTSNNKADHDFVHSDPPTDKGDVLIGDHVWIGVRVTVLQGVSIGNNTVVAAHSVVTRSLPANVIAGGNPCRILKIKSHVSVEEVNRILCENESILSDSLRSRLASFRT